MSLPRLLVKTRSLRSSFHRHVGTLGGASIKLARPADALRGIVDHLLPMRNPARSAGDRVEHGEYLGREAECLQRDRRIEVEIRRKPLLDEVIIGKRDALELKRHLKYWVVAMLTTYSFEHLGQGFPHNLCSWVIGLVHAIAKTHESERITLVLGALDVFRDAGDRADLLQHQQHRLVGTAMHRSPQTGDAS